MASQATIKFYTTLVRREMFGGCCFGSPIVLYGSSAYIPIALWPHSIEERSQPLLALKMALIIMPRRPTNRCGARQLRALQLRHRYDQNIVG